MATMTLAALVQASVLAVGAETYAEAYQMTSQTGQPMVVLVGAQWCGACKVMENTVLPQLRQRGILGRVVFAHVNLDQERELGGQLTDNGPIPQLVMFRKAKDGWRRRKLVGAQSVETVETFIGEGLQLDTAAKPEPEKPSAAVQAPAKNRLTSHEASPSQNLPPRQSPSDG